MDAPVARQVINHQTISTLFILASLILGEFDARRKAYFIEQVKPGLANLIMKYSDGFQGLIQLCLVP